MNTRKSSAVAGPAAVVPDRAAAGRLWRRHGAVHDLGQPERAADARHHGVHGHHRGRLLVGDLDGSSPSNIRMDILWKVIYTLLNADLSHPSYVTIAR